MRRDRQRSAVLCLLVLFGSLACLADPAYSQREGPENPASPAPLTQNEIERLDTMEREWASNIDNAVPYISVKDHRVSNSFLEKAADVVSRIGRILAAKGYNIASIDRLVAMERLTDAYMNMARIVGLTDTPQDAERNFRKIVELFDDTRRKVTEARAKFHQVPPLQDVCREFLAALDEFEREIKKGKKPERET